jgi:hypothetical protein
VRAAGFSDESVIDLATGKPLRLEIVTGAQAKIDSPNENPPRGLVARIDGEGFRD